MCLKPDQYFSFPFPERNFVFSWKNTVPWICFSRWKNGAYCLMLIAYKNWRHTIKLYSSHQSVSCKMH